MSGGGSPEVEIAKLELRADNADREIAALKVQREKDQDQYDKDREKDRDEVSTLRRSLAWIMGAAAVIGAILSQLLVTAFALVREGLK